MELWKVDRIEEAMAKLTAACRGEGGLPLETEEVPLADLLGRVLAEDIISGGDVPGFARSTVDGYAVRARETGGASESLPVFFHVAGEVEMGKAAMAEVTPGTCVYVPTGGMIPPGADGVVMVEYCEAFGTDQMAVYHHISEGKNVVMAGDDVKTGQLVLRRGRRIRPSDMGVLASIGRTCVRVYRPWRVAILSTGDEIVAPDRAPGPGQVRDVNSYGLYGQAMKLGLRVTGFQVVCDDAGVLLEKTRETMAGSDLVVLSGGSSQGKKDATARVIGQLASSGILTHGLAVKPGKPTILGYDTPSRTALIGLPGHPAAAMLLFDKIVGGLWAGLTGMTETEKEVTVTGVLAANVAAAPGRKTYQLVNLQYGGEEKGREGGAAAAGGGLPLVQPVLGRSGLIQRMSQADGYIVIEADEEGVNRGERVSVHLL